MDMRIKISIINDEANHWKDIESVTSEYLTVNDVYELFPKLREALQKEITKINDDKRIQNCEDIPDWRKRMRL